MAGFDFTNFNPKDQSQWNAFKDYSAGVTKQISNMPLAFTNDGNFNPNAASYGSSLLPAFGQFFPSGTQYTPAQTSTTQSLLGLVNGVDSGGSGGGGSDSPLIRNEPGWFSPMQGGWLANPDAWDPGAGSPSDYSYRWIPAGVDPAKEWDQQIFAAAGVKK